MFTEQDIAKLFPVHLPIAVNGKFWDGRPDEFSNIGCGLNYSQKFGLTPYAKTWVEKRNDWMYGSYNGKPRPHNGHDIAGFEDTPIVLPCRAYVSFIGYDPVGYGNYCFFETETITQNGESVKVEYVLAHMNEQPSIALNRWHDAGKLIGPMGKTGMSSGYHTHWGGRPLIRKPDGSWQWLFNNQASRGYIDLEPAMIEQMIFDKQILINIQKTMADFEKKIIIEGEAPGRKFVVVAGKLREITKDRESAASLYVMANNGLGKTVPKSFIENAPIGEKF